MSPPRESWSIELGINVILKNYVTQAAPVLVTFGRQLLNSFFIL